MNPARNLLDCLAIVLVTTALGCGSTAKDDEPAQASSGVAAETSPTATEAATTTGQASEATDDDAAGGDETGLPDDALEPPDCDTLVLPGDPTDVAQTPRSDRDAEVVALSLIPNALVAQQAHYDLVAADCATMRELVPGLADVHPECIAPAGYIIGTNSHELPGAVWIGSYRAWDCRNAYYGITEIRRIDGLAFMFSTPGVYGPGLGDLYRALPGFPSAGTRPVFPDVEIYNGVCEPTSGSITLDAPLTTDGALTTRKYIWQHPTMGTFVFEADAESAPALVE